MLFFWQTRILALIATSNSQPVTEKLDLKVNCVKCHLDYVAFMMKSVTYQKAEDERHKVQGRYHLGKRRVPEPSPSFCLTVWWCPTLHRHCDRVNFQPMMGELEWKGSQGKQSEYSHLPSLDGRGPITRKAGTRRWERDEPSTKPHKWILSIWACQQ